jgi:4-hydroxy-tetrahydrodipicolinate reductase
LSYRLLHVGLGPLGARIQTDLIARRLGTTVAAVDPAFAGKRLSELVPGAEPVVVARELAELRDVESLDAAIVTTRSDLRECAETFRWLLERGVSVVSTCEELVYPWLRHPGLAHELDACAKESGAQLLGTGVNPGFLMDALPVFATAVCHRVRSLRAFRIQDASPRRQPFQKKIGAGLSPAEFQRAIEAGWLRHVGLGESLHFCAQILGWKIERWSETIEPVLATRELDSKLGPIAPGRAAGVRQVAEAIVVGEPLLRFEFQAAIAQAEPHDRVLIDGDPPVDLVIRGGVHGDVATSAIVLNALRPLLASAPGLHTMATIPMVACASADARG